MDSKILIESAPVDLGFIDINPTEYMAYLYMPIKMIDSGIISYENRLDVFHRIISACRNDFVKEFGDKVCHERYMYITAKRLYVTPENLANRPGWHCDGFGTDDVNYIWTDKFPTVFNTTKVSVSPDDLTALSDMESSVLPENDYTFPVGHLLRLNSTCMHRVPTADSSGMRTFVKISFSKHRFNLQGNTRNYRFVYDWQMHQREPVRNMENKDFINQ